MPGRNPSWERHKPENQTHLTCSDAREEKIRANIMVGHSAGPNVLIAFQRVILPKTDVPLRFQGMHDLMTGPDDQLKHIKA